MSTVVKTYNTVGTFNWKAPTDVSSVQVELWGSGGSGTSRTTNGGGSGGSGGGYSKSTAVTVTPGSTYAIVIGNVGISSDGTDAEDTTFNSTTVVAKGGITAAPNATTGAASGGLGTGDVTFQGGAGANAQNSNVDGGGGGEGASAAGNGTSATTGAGGTGTDGGDGGAGRTGTQSNGTAGTAPGGAGGGGKRTSSGSRWGGAGAIGKAVLTYDSSVVYPSVRASAHDGSVNHSSSPGTTVTVTKPTGTVDGDIMYALLYVESSTSGALPGLSLPSGWATIYDHYVATTGNQQHTIVMWKRASSEGANYTWSWTGSAWYECVIISVKDAIATGTPHEATADGTDSGGPTVTTPEVTTTTDNCTWFSFMGHYNSGAATQPTDWTEEYDNSDVGHIASIPIVGHGATGTANWTVSSSNGAVAISVAVTPAATGSPFVSGGNVLNVITSA